MTARVAAALVLVLVACEPASGGTAAPLCRPNANTCVDDHVCGDTASCVSGVCYATQPEGVEFYAEITPSALASRSPSSPLHVPLVVSRGALAQADLVVPRTYDVSVVASIDVADASARGGCPVRAATGGVVRARLRMRRADQLPGLPAQVYLSDVALGSGDAAPQGLVLAGMPAGRYDAYAAPLDDGDCPPPPILRRSFAIPPTAAVASNATGVSVSLSPPGALRALSGTVRLRAGDGLEGWIVEVVDGETGFVLSTPSVVGPTGADGRAPFGTPRPLLFYDDASVAVAAPGVATVSAVRAPFLRLRPPARGVGPALGFSLDIANVQGDATIALDLRELASSLVTVTGFLEADAPNAGSPLGLPGHVFARRRYIDDDIRPGGGAPRGVAAYFAADVATDVAAGFFSLALFPGTYDVVGVPASDPNTFGRAHRSLSVISVADPSRSLGGTLLHVEGDESRRPMLHLRLTGPRGDDAIACALAEAVPRPDAALGSAGAELDAVFGPAFGASLWSPRVSSRRAGADGRVTLGLDDDDASLYYVVARPPDDTHWPWLVRYDPPATTTDGQLEQALPMSWPISLDGVVFVSASGAPLRGGTLRVYARPLGSSGAPARAFIPVAEAAIGRGGRYHMLLPSRL